MLRAVTVCHIILIFVICSVRIVLATDDNPTNNPDVIGSKDDSNTNTAKRRTDKKLLNFEYSLSYSQSKDSDNKFNTLTNGFELTYKPNEYLEFFSNLPVIYGRRTVIADSTASTNFDIGDIDFGLKYHLMKKDKKGIALNPFVKIKTNTGGSPYKAVKSENVSGDGHWSVEGGINLSKDINPTINVFSGASYTYYFDQSVNNQLRERHSSDSIHFGFDFDILDSLNASLSIERNHIGSSITSGIVTQESRTPIDVTTSMTYYFTSNISVMPYVSFGLNKQAEDYSFGISYSYNFNLL